MLLRDADARIRDPQPYLLIVMIHCDLYCSARFVVPDRVVAEIVDEFLHLLPVCADCRVVSLEFDGDLVLLCLDTERFHALVRDRVEVEFLICRVTARAHVELRKTDNIVDELQKPVRILMNLRSEPDCVLRGGDAGLNQFGIPGDR